MAAKNTGVLSFMPEAPIHGETPFLTETLGHDAVTNMARTMKDATGHTANLPVPAASVPEPVVPIVPQAIPKPAPVQAPTHHTVLVAVDESEPSRRALIWALDNFANEDVVLNIVSTITPSIDAMMPEDVQKQELAETKSAEEAKLVGWVSEAINQHGSTLPYRVQVVVGDAGEQLCALAESLNVRMVVVGSHGKGAIRRALLGSVSTYLTQHCVRPVLVVRE